MSGGGGGGDFGADAWDLRRVYHRKSREGTGSEEAADAEISFFKSVFVYKDDLSVTVITVLLECVLYRMCSL